MDESPHVTLLSDILSKERARLCQRPGTQEALVCLGYNFLFVLFFVLFFVVVGNLESAGDFSDCVSLSGLYAADFL